MKLVALVPVPPEVVTEMGPVVAPAGTVAVIRVLLFTVNVVADTPLNFTEVAPVKAVPVITTDVPTGPLVGLKDVTVGTAAAVTSKLAALVAVPSAFVTEIGPSVAPAGTVVVIVCGLLIVKVAETPLNFTAVTSGSGPVKLSPLISTDVPMGPLAGVNDEDRWRCSVGRFGARDRDREPGQHDDQRNPRATTTSHPNHDAPLLEVMMDEPQASHVEMGTARPGAADRHPGVVSMPIRERR